jgi:hypothetical protein
LVLVRVHGLGWLGFWQLTRFCEAEFPETQKINVQNVKLDAVSYLHYKLSNNEIRSDLN